MVRVGVDLMGSETSPQTIFEAVLEIHKELGTNDSVVVLAEHSLYPHFKKQYGASIEFITTEEAIGMDEPPLLAVRRKKNSSMSAGIRLLREKKLDAFVSTGNTGALVATAALHLPMLPYLERPALLVIMPTERGRVAVLDVGANITPRPEHLVSYAMLGSLYQQSMYGIKNPRIGLLNIGVEEQKGTKELKETYHMLQEKFQERFLGNIEGREVFQGKLDVLVTDGFTGNVFLKTSEGISTFLVEYLQKNFEIPEIVSHLHQQFNYAEHPGAFLCGVEGVVVKCHGLSDRTALMNGIRGAFTLVKKGILPQIKKRMY